MALDLDATLLAAQNSATRHPQVEIISAPAKSDIPLTGLNLSATPAVETGPFSLALSDNSTVVVHVSGTDIRFIYTDAAGLEFTPMMVTLTGQPIFGLSACELTGGNVGITYIENSGGNYHLKYRIVTKLGVAVSNGTIASWANPLFTSHTWVITLAADSYLMVYAKYSGSAYYIYKRTSFDFATWSGESTLSISGISTANKVDSPSLHQLDTGDIWLMFDYLESTSSGGSELRNIYYSVSSDNGAAWSPGTKVTGYDTYTAMGQHPVMLQREAGLLNLAYTENRSLLSYDGNSLDSRALGYDYVSNTLAILSVDINGGAAIVEIVDAGSLELLNKWDSTTIPAIIGSVARDGNIQINGGNRFIPLPYANYYVDVLDTEDETITQYNLVTGGGRTANVTWSQSTANKGAPMQWVMDNSTNKLWIVFSAEHSGHCTVHIGYIDVTAEAPYVFNVEWLLVDYFHWSASKNILIVPEDDYFIVNSSGANPRILVYTLSTKGLVKDYRSGTLANFPVSGFITATNAYRNSNDPQGIFYYNGCIYGTIQYNVAQPDYRGLAKIDMSTDQLSYHRPSWATLDNYFLTTIISGAEGKLIIPSYYYGITVYDIASDSWVLYDNSNVPGLSPGSFSGFNYIQYDEENDYIYTARKSGLPGGQNDVVMFPGSGTIKYSRYYSVAFSGGSWAFAYQNSLLKSAGEYDAVLSIDPNSPSAMYVFWQTLGGDIKWGKDGSSIDVSGYLVCGKEVRTSHNIKSDPYTLMFSCSHGHLFDPHNIYSLLRDCFRKGRRLTLRWGEKVSGVDYWQASGTFYVTETQGPRYELGVYSDITVTAGDMRTIWADSHIYATEYYNNYPEDIISDLLQAHAGLTVDDIDLPVFDNRILIEQQWVDTTLDEILVQLCWRFGYVPKITVDNKFSAIKISESAAVSHVYTGNDAIVSLEPDDKYSDFTNRVTVQGQEKTYINVTYAEEKVGTLNGTVGWYGCKKDFRVDYSEDGTRTCINPRLVVVESITSMGYFLADLTDITAGSNFSLGDNELSESITYADPENKYCIVRVTAPDLTFSLLTAIAALIGTFWIPDKVVSLGGGATIRIGSALTGLQSMVVMSILSAMGNYQVEIWATPTGRVRRSVQGSADDTVLQQEMGVVVEKKLEDPLCYSPADCIFVANNELMIARLQRKRVKIRKLAHLQEEEGDTIQVKHPYTGVDIKLLITDIDRGYTKPTSDGDGGFTDEIEGWII